MDEQTSLLIMKLIALLGDKLLFRYEILYEVAYHLTANGVTIPVRCKNCKHWADGVAGCTDHVKCCKIGFYMVGENGYCVYGERKD